MHWKLIRKLMDLIGSKEKQEFIRRNSYNKKFCLLLYYSLNPYLTYHVSVKTIQKFENEEIEKQPLIFFEDIFSCCEYLSRLRAMDDATLRQVIMFLHCYCEDEEREIYSGILSKSLRLGVTSKTVNKVIPNLIPEWSVQQAFPIEKYPIKEGTDFWLTQKLNGARATFYDGNLIARSGNPYENLEHITGELDWVADMGFTLDGELTLKNKGNLSDNEAFRKALGILNSDDKDKSEICYTIFDMIPNQEFEIGNMDIKYRDRRAMLDSLEDQIDDKDSVRVLPVLYYGKDQSMIDTLLDQMVREDKEGLMVNLDVPYQKKRHRGILKVKRFYTMDLPIVGYEEGSGRLKGSLGAFIVDYKGNEVRVGSGFSDEQRARYWKCLDDLEGELCEVKYKEISKDKKTGLESLQFPVFVGIRDDKTEVSYA